MAGHLKSRGGKSHDDWRSSVQLVQIWFRSIRLRAKTQGRWLASSSSLCTFLGESDCNNSHCGACDCKQKPTMPLLPVRPQKTFSNAHAAKRFREVTRNNKLLARPAPPLSPRGTRKRENKSPNAKSVSHYKSQTRSSADHRADEHLRAKNDVWTALRKTGTTNIRKGRTDRHPKLLLQPSHCRLRNADMIFGTYFGDFLLTALGPDPPWVAGRLSPCWGVSGAASKSAHRSMSKPTEGILRIVDTF